MIKLILASLILSTQALAGPNPTPSPNPKTTVVFVVGLNSPEGYAPLKTYITNFYKARLPVGTPWFITQWDHDVTAEIKAAFPLNRIVLVGHSFGGGKSAMVANDLGSKVKALVLIDPVKPTEAVQNNSGLTITAPISNVYSFIRPFGAVPWTARINPKTSTVEFTEFKYNCESADINLCHGLYVWKQRVVDLVKQNL